MAFIMVACGGRLTIELLVLNRRTFFLPREVIVGKADAAIGSKLTVGHDPIAAEPDQVQRLRPDHEF